MRVFMCIALLQDLYVYRPQLSLMLIHDNFRCKRKVITENIVVVHRKTISKLCYLSESGLLTRLTPAYEIHIFY